MTIDPDESETVVPDEAFALLGNETRMQILRALGEADGPLSFSELRDFVGIRDSGQFDYHLGKLAGHFIKETDGGYALGQKGSRIIEAVLSGAVTDTPVVERRSVDVSCHRCGAASIEVDYQQENLGVYCTECAGIYDIDEADHPPNQESLGYFGVVPVPPAAIKNRTPEELLLTALTWNGGEEVMASNGVCPRCSAVVTDSVSVCVDHDATDGLCDQCGTRYAVRGLSQCTNCPFEINGVIGIHLKGDPHLRAFFLDHDLDLLSPSSERVMHVLMEYDEEILQTDPFKGRFTFTIDEDTLTLTVDGNLSVTAATTGTVEGGD